MVALVDEKSPKEIIPKKFITNGDKISKKYKKAAIKKAEYRKLKAIVPSVANQRIVSKLTVIEEAIKYIDQLHSALVRKVLTTDSNNNIDDPKNNEANEVLHNLQRSCDNKALPFSCADDFIRNFILQQQQQQQIFATQMLPQNSLVLQRRNVNINNSSIGPSLAEKPNNMFPQHAERVAQQMRMLPQQMRLLPQQNATLTTETLLSSTSTMLPKVATISRRVNESIPSNDFVSINNSNTLRPNRMLF